MIGTVTDLSEPERRMVEYVAKNRIHENRRRNAQAELYYKEDQITAEINHYGAEVAFCKMWNVYPQIDYLGVYTNWDCIDCLGKTIDVKSSPNPNSTLLVKKKVWNIIPDFFVLMVGMFPLYKYCGAMPSALIMVDERSVHIHTDSWEAKQDELVEIVYDK